jgi:hypothetical protein
MFNTAQRTEQLQQVAAKLAMTYKPTDEWGVQQQLQDFRLFQRGFSGRLRHVLTKQDGLLESKVYIFDYRYLLWAGKSTRRVEQTVFFLESRKLGLPEFYLRPENFFHRIAETLGLVEDIDFEEYLDFSNNYRLTGSDEEYIRHNFQDEILRFFAIEKGWSMEGLGFYLVLYKKGKVLAPNVIADFYRKGMRVYGKLKEVE